MDNTNTNQRTDNRPDNFLFIIGAMKCGTTSLFDILGQHPQICASSKKEPDYFTKDNSNNSHDEYLSLWDWQNDHHSVAIEASVAYSKAPSVPGVPVHIQKSNLGQYRFLYMLRNPLSRIESQVRHGLFAGWGKSLDAGIPEDAINFSSYAMQLDKYLDIFPRESILLVTLEQFKSEPNRTLGKICEFLQIDTDFEFNNVEKTRNSGDFFNTSSTISHITQNRISQFIAHKILPEKTKSWLRNIITNLNKGKSSTSSLGRWQLTDEEKNHIIKRLTDDLKKLESDFGIDIDKYWHIQSSTLEDTQT